MQETHLRVVYSQDLETLCDLFIKDFFCESGSVFASRLVVVPHLEMKEFLLAHLISRLQIATGLQILPLHQAVMEICDRGECVPVKKIPSLLELSLAIQEQLLQAHEITDPHFQEYAQAISSHKITSLSRELAKLFTRYGLFGEEFLPSWLAKEGWQQDIWKKVFEQYSYPLEFFSQLNSVSFNGKIALFGFSYIPSVHLRFFTSLDASCYLFSPCSLFWEDVVSDRERLKLDRNAMKQGVCLPVREQLNSYMKLGHPLLANWGKMGKQMLTILQQIVVEEEDQYRIPESNRLLQRLQSSILNLDESEPLFCDDSIQVHSASCRLREIESLRDVLESVMQKHSILPQEVLVVAPDIDKYAPLIKKVFSASPLPFSIEEKGSLEGPLEGFLTLINLPKNRFSLQKVITFLQHQSSFSKEEVDSLQAWFKSARILFDVEGHPQSWGEGLDRLLFGLSIISSTEPWPLSCIPHSEIDVFNRFLELFMQVQQDLLQLEGKKTLPEWLTLFLQMAQTYCVNEESSFLSELLFLQKSFINASAEWAFEDVYPLIQSLAEESQEKRGSSSMGKIVFSSLNKTPLKPARVIWCLGLDEESFPRVEVGSSLCGMQKGLDTFPTRIDQDRFAFLEMIMKAKEYFFMSYERIDPKDSKEKGVSLLIEELNSYLMRRGLGDGLLYTHHPSFALDATYFSNLSLVKRWSFADYASAKAYYSPAQSQKPFFLPTSRSETVLKEGKVITIAQLKKCARHPLQLYFNETLQLFLQEEENEEEEEFVLSSLKKSLFRKEGLQKEISMMTRRIESEGKLPLGGWKEAALYELEEEIQGIVQALNQFTIRKEEITSIHFVDCLQEESSSYSKPLLRVGSLKIQGALEGVTSQGLLFHGTSHLSDLIKVWPLYLIYLHLYPQTPYLLLTKERIKLCISIPNPQEALQSYLSFYVEALQTPCPLLLSSVKGFLEGDLAEFRASVEKENEDPYWNYVKRKNALSELEPFFSFWQPRIKGLYAAV